MKISVHDLAHSKGMPAAATEAMLAMQDRIEALTAENERLRGVLIEIRDCTGEHGGAAKALKLISAALGGEQ